MKKLKVHRIVQDRGHYVAVCGGKYTPGFGVVFPGKPVTCSKCSQIEKNS